MSWKLKYPLRDWQGRALDLWSQNLSGVVSVVTGGGKTVFAYVCIQKFVERYPEGRIYILVPTVTLLDQWTASLLDEFNVDVADIRQYSGDKTSRNPGRINVLIINTARSKIEEMVDGQPSMLIVDECHRAGSPVNSKSIKGSFVATLGLSATPERENDNGFYEHISPALGPLIFKYSYREAKRDKVICDFDLLNVKVPMSSSEEEAYSSLTSKITKTSHMVAAGKCDEGVLRNQLLKRARVSSEVAKRIPVAIKLVSMHPGERTIVFHESIEAANTICSILSAQGKSATLYHSKLGSNIRRANLLNYRRGVFDILVTCRALDEGMNAPETSVAVIASSTSSARQRVQRLGRVLRPSVKKSRSVIYTLYCTEIERRRLEAEENDMQGVANVKWLSSK